MKLPVVNAPSIVCYLPLSGKKVSFRPFVMREQKALLLAQESNHEETIYESIRSVIKSCTNGEVDLEQIPVTDLSWLFLQMKIASSGPEHKISVKCDSCKDSILMMHNLAGASVNTEGANLRVELSPTVGIIFHWPTISDYIHAFKSKDSTMKYIYMIVESLYDENQVYTKNDFSEEEFMAWMDELTDQQLFLIKQFMDSIPELRQEINYTCPHCKHEHRKLLEGLHDFFRLDDGE